MDRYNPRYFAGTVGGLVALLSTCRIRDAKTFILKISDNHIIEVSRHPSTTVVDHIGI
jgi:hypothetical protein